MLKSFPMSFFSQLKSICQLIIAPMQAIVPFFIGGFSGAFATLCIQPIDTFKVQIQVMSEKMGKKIFTLGDIFRKIRAEKGLSVFYRGLDSAILRQIFYASTRLGAYDVIMANIRRSKEPSKMQKTVASFIGGVFGALVGNPFDIALIRRQASITSSARNYTNTLNAFISIVKQEGFLSLWTGIEVTIMRVVIINFCQLAARDMIYDSLTPTFSIQVSSNLTAIFASFLTSFLSLPADNIKVKLQKQHKTEKIYTGIFDCLFKSIKKEGISRLWVGFGVYLVRGMPHSFLLIRTQMFLNDLLKKYKEKNKQ